MQAKPETRGKIHEAQLAGHQRSNPTLVWALLIAAALIACGTLAGAGILAVTWNVVDAGRLRVPGELQPLTRQKIFAPAEATLAAVLVTDGDRVRVGDMLVRLSSEEIAAEEVRLKNQLQLERTRLEAVNQSLLQSDTSTVELGQLTAEATRLKTTVSGLQAELDIVRRRRDALVVQSPLDGEILAEDLAANLNRPLARGDYLATVADLTGDWEILLELEEAQAGMLLKARAAAAGPLPVKFKLGTDPRWGQGHVSDLSTSRDSPGLTIVHVAVDIEQIPQELRRPGTSVEAVIRLPK